MSRLSHCAIASVVAGACALCGCSADPQTSEGSLTPSTGQLQLIGNPDFDWYLSGDRRVAPLQVFSDQWRIWLQWHPGQPVPSVLVLDAGQWQVAEPREHGKFSVIEGQWQQLRFQGGPLRADARHGREHHLAQVQRKRASEVSVAPGVPDISQMTSDHPARLRADSDRFQVRLTDQTIRQTLTRWAADHRWHFENSHWAVPVDLPVTARAEFEGDFIGVVRALLDATDIAGRPLQPCFYANRVLRVVSANESCDPTAKQTGVQ